jgi:hypothetical protein
MSHHRHAVPQAPAAESGVNSRLYGKGAILPFFGSDYRAENTELLTAAFNVVWDHVIAQNLTTDHPTAAAALTTTLTKAINEGERDRARLADSAWKGYCQIRARHVAHSNEPRLSPRPTGAAKNASPLMRAPQTGLGGEGGMPVGAGSQSIAPCTSDGTNLD